MRDFTYHFYWASLTSLNQLKPFAIYVSIKFISKEVHETRQGNHSCGLGSNMDWVVSDAKTMVK
jgi:hypothetical protein